METGIPLEAQLRLYEERFDGSWEERRRALASETYREHIRKLGRKRLIAGYEVFGDEMYHWSRQLRQANIDEEIADAVVYGTGEERPGRATFWTEQEPFKR